MILTDTHCHLYGEEFADDIENVIESAGIEGVSKFYLPGLDSSAIGAMVALEVKFPNKCIAMIGLHPCYVKENYLKELELVNDWLSKRKFAAIGEIGLPRATTSAADDRR